MGAIYLVAYNANKTMLRWHNSLLRCTQPEAAVQVQLALDRNKWIEQG